VTSRLVEFYAGRGRDSRGRAIEDIWSMSLDELEQTHDYIQWLFPLRERSAVEPLTPTLDDAAIAEFQATVLQERLVRSAATMAAFYGFQVRREGNVWRVDLAPNAPERQRVWLTPGNHNFLRLTRIMKSLATLGARDLSSAWLGPLRALYHKNATVIGPRTWRFWESAPSSS
jgi:hypothetical protein